MNDSKIEQYISNLKDIMKKCGYVIQGVNGDGNNPSYAYTVGRELLGKDDFIIFNIIDSKLINLIIEKFDEYRSSNTAGYQTKIILSLDSFKINGQDARFMLIKIDPAKCRQLCLGCWNKKLGVNQPIGFYQIVYADTNNILPDEEGFNEEYSQSYLTV